MSYGCLSVSAEQGRLKAGHVRPLHNQHSLFKQINSLQVKQHRYTELEDIYTASTSLDKVELIWSQSFPCTKSDAKK
jgi:hypothetical protein